MLLLFADFFQKELFQKILSETLVSGCQTVWIQIRTDILWVLIWVQRVCKGYQQATKVVTSKGRIMHQSIVTTAPDPGNSRTLTFLLQFPAINLHCRDSKLVKPGQFSPHLVCFTLHCHVCPDILNPWKILLVYKEKHCTFALLFPILARSEGGGLQMTGM